MLNDGSNEAENGSKSHDNCHGCLSAQEHSLPFTNVVPEFRKSIDGHDG